MSSAVMNDTDAGASVTDWLRADAPKTRPASIRMRSSSDSSDSDCAFAAVLDITSVGAAITSERKQD